MISSFWNLCRACPLPLEKIHSEYRSTFQWHPKLEIESAFQPVPVVRQPTQNQFRSSLAGPTEPVIPRRKKHPDLAYRTNEWFGNCSAAPKQQNSKMTAVGESIGIKPKKSISMGIIPVHAAGQKSNPKAHNKFNEVGMDIAEAPEIQESSANIMPDLVEGKSQSDSKNDTVVKRKEYKTEYKNRFRPFSQYEYVDGKFLKKDKDQETTQNHQWYTEVIELRKKAGEYKFRGWGTDLGSSNPPELFNQQLWEQVSRRSSLAPLALITPTPRYTPKEEKDKRNAKKRLSGKEGQPRPHTATPKHASTDLDRGSRDSEAVQLRKKKTEGAQKRPNLKGKARSQSAGPINRSSPQKTTTRQPSAASSVSEKENVSCGWKVPTDYDPKPKQRYIRPTTLATSPRSRASSGKGDLDANSKLANQHRVYKSSADPSLGYSESSVVKSPVEPTRVKSPDQAGVKSPDGVKWTVPLDTTKGFIVTQNIREAQDDPKRIAFAKVHCSGSDDANAGGLEPNIAQSKIVKVAVNGNEEKSGKKFGPIFSKSKALPPPALKKTEDPSKQPSLVSDVKVKDPLEEPDRNKVPKKNVTLGKSAAPIRCLDDEPPSASADKNKISPGKPLKKIPEKVQPKGIRVLEAPAAPAIATSKPKAADPVPQTTRVAAPAVEKSDSNRQTKEAIQPKASTYRVLEAPTLEKPMEKPASGSKASDVLKKARHRFDKFWSKSKEEE